MKHPVRTLASNRPERPSRTVIGLVCLALFVVSLFVLGVNAEQLILGWLYFPLRTVPLMTVDWPTAILGAVCVLCFVIVLHKTAQWFLRSKATADSAWASRWTWRSSLVASAVLFVLFAAGTACVGATHQFLWLVSGRNEVAAANATPVYGFIAKAREAARQAQARNEANSFALAFQNVNSTYEFLPPGGTIDESGQLLHGWAAFLGPYHSYDTSEIDFRVPWRSPPNDRIYKCQLQCFVNPSQPGPLFDAEGYGLNHWSGNIHVLPLQSVSFADNKKGSSVPNVGWARNGTTLSDMKDGSANTILLGSAKGAFKPWGHPANLRDPATGINMSPDGFGGPPGWDGAVFAFCDGSVRMVSDRVDPRVVEAMARPDDGLVPRGTR